MSCLSRLNFFATILLLSCANVAQALDTSDVLVVDLYMNHESMGEAFVLQDDDGGYLVDESVLLHWNINAPWPAPRTFLGNEYYAIGKFPGASADLKDRLMELHISMPAELMATRYVDMRRRGQLAPATEFGVYMDYELNHIARERFGGQSSYGLFRPVVFGPQGSVNSNLLYRKFNSAAVTDESSGLVVLDLTYTRDDPSNVRSLRVGDIITRANRMGRALRFGGIQVATNFGTQPTMITYPLPSFYGQTEVPTALDIYVNGRLTRREEVQPGPYVLEDVPVVSGAGQLQVVARDALGRQQVFVQDFYLSTQLLREGLNDYSFNIGALREDFGIENFQYGDLAASATWRHGLRSDLTVEGHTEMSDGLLMLAGGAQYQIESGGLFNGSLGISTGDQGAGARVQFGFSQATSLLSYNVEIAGASRNFATVGSFASAPKLQFVATVGAPVADFGSLGMALVHQQYYQAESRSILSANHSFTLSNLLSVSTRLSYTDTLDGGFSAGIRFTKPFGRDHVGTGGISNSWGATRLEAGIRKSLRPGTGMGYHVAASAGQDNTLDAGVVAQNEVGLYSADLRSSEFGGRVWQLNATGSIAHLDGMTSFTRQIRNAFAVVNVGDFEGVRVYSDNREMGRTNHNGQLFIPRLTPYIKNTLRIEVQDLPLNASIDSLDKITAPYFRSGVVVNFGVRISRNVMLRAIMPDGGPVPEGSTATIQGTHDTFPVGLDGRLYLQGIDRSSRVAIRWYGTICDMTVPEIEGDAVIPRLGDVVCEPRNLQ